MSAEAALADQNTIDGPHTLSNVALPANQKLIYLNEPWMFDELFQVYVDRLDQHTCELPEEADNVRVYMPLDLNANAILRRMACLLGKYDDVNEQNEINFNRDVTKILEQVEIYDQIWLARNRDVGAKHSHQAQKLVRDIVALLENVEDGCAERPPEAYIQELQKEYLANGNVQE